LSTQGPKEAHRTVADRVCAIQRAALGDRLVQVRLIGPHTDERWPLSPGPEPSLAPEDAAAWIDERLRASSGARLLALCVDVEGAHCQWLSAPGPSADTILASMALGKDGTDWSSRLGSTWSPPTADDQGVQALAVEAPKAATGSRWTRKPKAEPPAQRLAIVTVPDVQARLLADALDERGINAPVAISFWHAMARAWDPAVSTPAHATGQAHDRIIGHSAVPCAVLVVDQAGCKLLWCWASQGYVLAAGTHRLEDEATIDEAGLARLTNDWLAWSMQLGFGPSRVVFVGPPARSEGPDRRSTAALSTGLTPGALQRLMGKLWPGATIQTQVHEDPIGATLRALLASSEHHASAPIDPRQSLVALSHRPTRAHRSLYRAAALVLVAASIGLAGIAWRLWQAAGVARARAEAQDSAIRQAISAVRPAPEGTEVDVFVFEQDLQRLREKTRTPKGLTAAKPIMQELDTIAAVVGSVAASNPAVQLEEILLTTVQPRVRVIVPDTATGEEIEEAMGSVAGTNVDWRGEFPPASDPSKRRFEIKGFWKPEVGGPAAGSQGPSGGGA
jgi:hypothetical protein